MEDNGQAGAANAVAGSAGAGAANAGAGAGASGENLLGGLAQGGQGGSGSAGAGAGAGANGGYNQEGGSNGGEGKTDGGSDVNDGGQAGNAGGSQGSDGSGASNKQAKQAGEGGQGQGEPIAYTDFSVPEGTQLPDGFIDGLKDFASKNGLTQAQAQSVLDLQFKAQAQSAMNFDAAIQSQRAESEKVLGLGPQRLKNLESARRAIAHYGGDELTQLFASNPLLDTNPILMKLFVKIGQELGEDTMPDGSPVNLADVSKMTTGQVLYPNMKLV